MAQLILVRHGQSDYNLKNLFTGWLDVDLTEQGIQEAKKAAQSMSDKKMRPHLAFTSALKRAQHTLKIILKDLELENIPVMKDQALNERHYGELQGKNKAETAEQFGEEQVKIWRRSFDVPPPGGESLKDTMERTLPYFDSHIKPELLRDRDVLVVAHGNSLRSIVMAVEKMTPEQILKTELATGEARIYNFDTQTEQFSLVNNPSPKM
ncbi:MAG: 2,3-bisphosphoglycerate-dependent phosphoglycerate mutase [Bdellovibrionales bacterium CG10_big_fil_rev_8_21_14_0_10_45_34]|nr:MAG: 2,3-bisphosphoglycerate-dependent phosphoglycerate mutase [Bdellovibrionales bacterium CG10_big_fil_rev_8_21_14_0_10_45_34]